MIGELRGANVSVSEDGFTATTPIGPVPMTNIVATTPGASRSTIIIGGHYDTKRMATSFVGANDGGSSAALPIELARELVRTKQKLTCWLVFFDGQEALARWSATDGLYGSRHFAERLRERGAEDRVKAVIIVDMIGDAHLDLQRESYSTPWLTDLVFTQAKRLGYGPYFAGRSRRIEDDQLPFLQLGIRAVDLIDLDYGPLNAVKGMTRSASLIGLATSVMQLAGESMWLRRPSESWSPHCMSLMCPVRFSQRAKDFAGGRRSRCDDRNRVFGQRACVRINLE